jgi:hypothetical protein
MSRRTGKRGSIAAMRAQCRATLAMLPFVAALDFDEELLVRIFGLTMGVLNWLPDPEQLERELELRFAEFEAREPPKPRSREEQRAYWRRMQREYRERKKTKQPST